MPSNCALRLKALRDFDDDKIKRIAGDEWLFEGPGNKSTLIFFYLWDTGLLQVRELKKLSKKSGKILII